MTKFERQLENEELIQKLRDHGYGELVDAAFNHDGVYTKGGRFNRSTIAKLMGLTPNECGKMLAELREIVKDGCPGRATDVKLQKKTRPTDNGDKARAMWKAGKGVYEIVDALNLSTTTVRWHLKRRSGAAP